MCNFSPQHRANTDDDQVDNSDYYRNFNQQDRQANQEPKNAQRDAGRREHQRHADRQHKQGQQNHSYHSQNIRRLFHSLNLFRALAAYLLVFSRSRQYTTTTRYSFRKSSRTLFRYPSHRKKGCTPRKMSNKLQFVWFPMVRIAASATNCSVSLLRRSETRVTSAQALLTRSVIMSLASPAFQRRLGSTKQSRRIATAE